MVATAGISGSFRIRARQYNGQSRAVDELCDSGHVGFSVKPVAVPQLPAVTAAQREFRDANFQEQITEALATLDGTINDRDRRAACALMTARLQRSYCRGRKDTIERLFQQLTFITDNAQRARRSGRRAVVTFQTGDVTMIAGRTTHGERTLWFSGSESTGWKLDRIGPHRQVPGEG